MLFRSISHIISVDQSSLLTSFKSLSITKAVTASVNKVPIISTNITGTKLSYSKDKCITTPTPTGINSNGR